MDVKLMMMMMMMCIYIVFKTKVQITKTVA